jgi:hypothetical protein
VFQAVDLLNGRLLCGCQDVKACAVRLDAQLLPLMSICMHYSFILDMATMT